MAFTGVSIACGYVSAPPSPALFGAMQWSQTMSAAGTTGKAATASDKGPPGATGSNLAFEVTSDADIWVAISETPDATNGPRVLVRAGETRNLFAKQGERVAWILA
ncbi:hypothetical protein FHR71_005422 [Methylobacterium sp. RAS18]|nr:hypothetical protein [Methylobacterium sp. RAS18]